MQAVSASADNGISNDQRIDFSVTSGGRLLYARGDD
jgi:hypothetical protein